MAFDTTNGSNSGSNRGNDRTNDDSWKAHGFINLYVKNKAGTRTKLGTIPLKAANAREKQLSDWLANDPEKTNLGMLANAIEVEYNPADTGDASHFDLPFDQAAK